jgi:hypothetical protein
MRMATGQQAGLGNPHAVFIASRLHFRDGNYHDVKSVNASSHAVNAGGSFVAFPLNPALSLGERKNRFPSLGKSENGDCSTALEPFRASECGSLSPRERVRVRGK